MLLSYASRSSVVIFPINHNGAHRGPLIMHSLLQHLFSCVCISSSTKNAKENLAKNEPLPMFEIHIHHNHTHHPQDSNVLLIALNSASSNAASHKHRLKTSGCGRNIYLALLSISLRRPLTILAAVW